MNKETRLALLQKLSSLIENAWQPYLTPPHIANNMIELLEHEPDMKYLIMFDLAFVEALTNFRYNMGVAECYIPASNVVFVADSPEKAKMAKLLYGVESVLFEKDKIGSYILGEKNKPSYFSQEFIKVLEQVMPKSDKLVIFGNPPYQEMTGKGARENDAQAKPIYNKFIDACISMSPRYLSMIVPSRWMQGGRGLDDFRNRMKADKHIKVIKHFPGTRNVFENVHIDGGVSYFLWDSSHNGVCNFNGQEQDLNKYDIIIMDSNAIPIIDKLDLSKNLSQIVLSRKPFGLPTNFKNWSDSGFKCYSSHGRTGFVNKEDFTDKFNVLDKWKICIGYASSARNVEDSKGTKSVIQSYIVVAPQEICTETHLVINSFNTKQEADNFASYMKTKMFRYLMSLSLEGSYHTSKDSFAFVPDLQDYSHPWDDKQVCEKLGITDEEWQYIDSKIRDWKEDTTEEEVEESEEGE